MTLGSDNDVCSHNGIALIKDIATFNTLFFVSPIFGSEFSKTILTNGN